MLIQAIELPEPDKHPLGRAGAIDTITERARDGPHSMERYLMARAVERGMVSTGKPLLALRMEVAPDMGKASNLEATALDTIPKVRPAGTASRVSNLKGVDMVRLRRATIPTRSPRAAMILSLDPEAGKFLATSFLLMIPLPVGSPFPLWLLATEEELVQQRLVS